MYVVQTLRAPYDRHVLTSGLVKLDGDEVPHRPRRMTLNGDTRWLSHWRMIRYFRENQTALTSFVTQSPANRAAFGVLAVSNTGRVALVLISLHDCYMSVCVCVCVFV